MSWEYIERKAAMGSYKAADKLLGLLEFCSRLYFGPEAFDEWDQTELQLKLQEEYSKNVKHSFDKDNPIEMAFRWSLPPSIGDRIVFSKTELLLAARALFELVCAKSQGEIIKQIVFTYSEDGGDLDQSGIYIGEDIKVLGIDRHFIVESIKGCSESTIAKILEGYDSAGSRA